MDYQFLGRVSSVSKGGTHNHTTVRIDPLQTISITHSSDPAVAEVDGVMQTGAPVIWFRVEDSRAQEGALYLFSAEEIPDGNPGYPEKYRVELYPRPQPVFQIVDFQGSTNQLRKYVREHTFGEASAIVIRLNHQEFVGPFTVSETEMGFVADPKQFSKDQIAIKCSTSEENSIQWEGNLYIPEPSLRLTGRTVDFRDSHDITVTALKKLMESDKKLSEQTGVSKRGVNVFLDAIRRSTFSDIDAFRMEVALEYLTDATVNDDLSAELSEVICAHPRIQAEIIARSENEVQKARELADELSNKALVEFEEMRNEAKAESLGILADAKSRITSLRTDEAKLKDEIESNRKTLQELIVQVNSRIAMEAELVEAAIVERIDSFNDRIHESLADVMWLRAVSSMSSPNSKQISTTTEVAQKPICEMPSEDFEFPDVADSQLTEFDSHESVLKSLCKVLGELEGKAIIQGLLSQSLPVVFGPDAFMAVQKVAEILAAGRVLWVTVEPGYVSPRDLVLERAPEGQPRPAANRILDLMIAAMKSPEKLYVLALEGINRSAIDSYLVPMLRVYSGDQPSVPLFRPEQMPTEIEFHQFAKLAFPHNVLFMATASDLSEDFTSLPISKNLWALAVPVSARSMRHRATEKKEFSNVRTESWVEWRSTLNESVVKKLDLELREIHSSLGYLVPASIMKRMRDSAKKCFGTDPGAAVETMARWLPLVLQAKDLAPALEILTASQDWDDERHPPILDLFRVQ